MPYERTGYAPWSLTREAGVQSATVDGTIQVPQYVTPVLDTGFVNVKGEWKGRRSSDEQFLGITKAEGIPNSGTVLFPDTPNHPSINMTGFRSMYIAIKPNNDGNIALAAIMGPDTKPFGNLTPVSSGDNLRGSVGGTRDDWGDIMTTSGVGVSANAWNIYYYADLFTGQKNMQWKITNTDLGNSNFECAFMRLV